MRLSEAMMLGKASCKMLPHELEHCALGAGAKGVGLRNISYSSLCEVWPWLNTPHSERGSTFDVHIGVMFDTKVCKGLMTFEQLVDYVHGIEPECGECNKFTCTCVRKMDDAPQT